MSLVANESTEFTSLRIVGSSDTIQTTLKNKLLKNMEKYSAVVRTFYTNAVPTIFPYHYDLIKIYPKDDLDAAVNQFANNPHFLSPIPNHVLTIPYGTVHNILGLVESISSFIKEVNKNIFIYGSVFGANAAYYIAPGVDLADQVQIHDDVDPGEPNISFSIDSAGLVIFDCSQAFLDQWYIEINPDFAKLLDISRYLWAGTNTQNQLVYEGRVFQQLGEDITATLFREPVAGTRNFNFTINSTTTDGRGLVFSSKRSIFLADQRQTLVVEMSLPFSRTIHSENGKHVEKYRLCEFPIDNYIESRGTLESLNGQALAKVTLTDTLQGGLTDLTRGFQETHIIHFLPGDLYTVNTRIYIVYKSFAGGKIETPFDLDGFYDLELLFTKKQDVRK